MRRAGASRRLLSRRGQIDGQGNVNLVGTGDYPNNPVRWPGSFGSAYLYFLVPRVILFREEHSLRSLVQRVDFVSAPGVTGETVYRRGGPHALLTNAALFSFERAAGRFRLESIHPGYDWRDIRGTTGFAYDNEQCEATTPSPDDATLSLIRGRIREELRECYPQFAGHMPDPG